MFLQYETVAEVSLTIMIDGKLQRLEAREDVGSGPSKGVVNDAYARCKVKLLDTLARAHGAGRHLEIRRTQPFDADALASP